MKIIFAGTPAFAVPSLDALVRAGHDIWAVYTQPDRAMGRGRRLSVSPVKQFALEQNFPVLQPESIRSEADHIRTGNCDLMVVVAYGMMLPQDVLNAPHMGCINVHASILPRWRGAAPIQRAIEAGDQQTGISVMRMEAGLDTGPVYRIAKTSIGPEDTAQSIHDRLAVLGAKTLIETIDLLAEGTAHAVEQDNDQASYAGKLEKTEAEISWSLSAVELHRRIRAFNPWPVCQTSHRGNRLRIWEAQILSNVTESLPAGTVSGIVDGMIMVSCGTGKLGLKRLQREGAKPLAADEFLRGYRIAVGDVLGRQSQATAP